MLDIPNPIKYIMALKNSVGRGVASDLVRVPKRTLTAAQYGDLADVPPAVEWLANIGSRKTRKAYKIDVAEFSGFTGLTETAQLRTFTRAHLIAWRKDMEIRSLCPQRSGAGSRRYRRSSIISVSAMPWRGILSMASSARHREFSAGWPPRRSASRNRGHNKCVRHCVL